MPPLGKKRPDEKVKVPAMLELEKRLTEADASRRKVVLRRLNRVQYENTVRDLFAIRAEVRELLPEDRSAQGFDTVGDALGVSTEQIQAYLEAADIVLDAALGTPKAPERISRKFPLIQDCRTGVGKLFRETPEGVAIFNTGYIPTNARSARILTAGTYRFRIHARAFQSDKPVTMQVKAGDVITNRRPYRVQGYYDLTPDKMTVVEFEDWFTPGDTIHVQPYGVPATGTAYAKTLNPGIVVGDIEVEGPLEPWPPRSREMLLGKIDPKGGSFADAEAILKDLLPRAFRRSISPAELAMHTRLVKSALDQGRPFIDALRVALKAMLCSPAFLYLEEPLSKPGGSRIESIALASRLSYFLWSSMPDATLLAAARDGELDTPKGLQKHVERMLVDPRASAFTEHFTDLWLNLRDFNFTQPDKTLYPEFDDGLKVAMLAETRLFFDEMLRKNRDIREFVDSDWTFLNQRLAAHYGIPNVSGSAMRKVHLPKDCVRGGLLTQASILKVTANGTNTSPVVRGVWVLNKILGTPPPPPPSGVPAVEPDIRGSTTIREQLAKHRNSANCAGCHRRIDPPGFALEAFDVIGGQREWYRSLGAGERVNRAIQEGSNVLVRYRKGPPVDASGELSDGQRFKDIREFKQIIKANPEQIARNLTEKLLIYGVGRELGFSDRPGIEQIVVATRQNQWGFRSLVHEVIQSELFRLP